MFFQCNNCYTNAPQCYVTHTLPILLFKNAVAKSASYLNELNVPYISLQLLQWCFSVPKVALRVLVVQLCTAFCMYTGSTDSTEHKHSTIHKWYSCVQHTQVVQLCTAFCMYTGSTDSSEHKHSSIHKWYSCVQHFVCIQALLTVVNTNTVPYTSGTVVYSILYVYKLYWK